MTLPLNQGVGMPDVPVNSIIHGDCVDVMRTLPDCCVDAVVCDPPYDLTDRNGGRGFMGKEWDSTGIAFKPDTWREALRVLKPGGYLLAFGGSRTYHRMACAVEDAGFEVRDQVMWIYGQGFPKSRDVSKAIDKAAGAEREVVGVAKGTGKQNPAWNGTEAGRKENSLKPEYDATIPATPAAQQWQGWGTALKPAHEPVCMARKPFKGTVANCVLEHGTGAINVGACRIAGTVPLREDRGRDSNSVFGVNSRHPCGESTAGRWPANLLLDAQAAELLDQTTGVSKSTGGVNHPTSKFANQGAGQNWKSQPVDSPHGFGYGDSGGASRYFKQCNYSDADLPLRMCYTAKASKKERNAGLGDERNDHPTCKPISVMKYLCKLVTQPGGVILDPFAGSGTTCIAATLEGFNYIGIDMDEHYCDIARRRLAHIY